MTGAARAAVRAVPAILAVLGLASSGTELRDARVVPKALSVPVGRLSGAAFLYTVSRGVTSTQLSARLGISEAALLRENGLGRFDRLTPGRALRIDNRHIVLPAPPDIPGGARGVGTVLVVNIPQRMLYRFEGGALEQCAPVGVGRRDWQTPTGQFYVATKEREPVWVVPKSIQEEMRREGKEVLTVVPHCDENPLGEYWLGLNAEGIGIHGTIAPLTVYAFLTHGCLRVHPDDVAFLFVKVEVATPVEIVYEPILLAFEGDRVYLEAHRDVYRRLREPSLPSVRRALREIEDRVDWAKVEELLQRREGIARDVTKGDLEQGSRDTLLPLGISHRAGKSTLAFARAQPTGGDPEWHQRCLVGHEAGGGHGHRWEQLWGFFAGPERAV